MQKSILSIKSVVKKYRRGNNVVTALSGVDLEIPHRSILGVIGKNGAGKSTLFRCLIGLEKWDAGSIFFDGTEIFPQNAIQLRAFRRNIGVVFQQLHLFSSRTVQENVAYPLEIVGVSLDERKSRVAKALSLLGLEAKSEKYTSQLSGGEKQRVAIARAIVHEPKILLCDEATSALDPETFNSLIDVLKTLHKQLDITIVLITHHPEMVQKLCTHVGVLKEGRISVSGTKNVVFEGCNDKNDFITNFKEGGSCE